MTRFGRWFLFLVLVVFLCACFPSPIRADRFKILVTQDAFYRVVGSSLASVGADLDRIDPATFQLFRGNREVAIRVRGEGKSLTLDFYGQASDSPYSAFNVYWLRWGIEKGKRIGEMSTSDLSTAPVESFQDVSRFERPTLYVPQAGASGKPWFWQSLPAPTTSTITLSLPSALSDPAALQLNLWGSTQDPASPDHHLSVFFNETRIADEIWDGQGSHIIVGDIPPTAVVTGDNLLRLVAPGDTKAAADITLLSSVVVTYTRRLVSDKDNLAFQAGRGTYWVEGFTGASIDVFDVTDPAQPSRLTGVTTAKDSVRFSINVASPHHWLAVGPAGYHQPTGIAPMTLTSVREKSRAADYVVITHPDFVRAIQPLVLHRERSGLRVAVLTTDEIYDEFSAGNATPLALRDFLASRKPSPRFVLLVGKASYDYRDYTKGPNQNLVPTFLIDTPNLRQAGSDNWYASPDDSDIHPSFAIGRIPAKTPDQVTRAVDKIISYESASREADWRGRAIFVADDKDASFAEMGDILADKLPAQMNREKVYLGANKGDVKATRAEMVARWNDGALLLSYIGHGSLDTWAEGPLFSSQNLADLHNTDRLPILFTPTCLDGFFYHPQKDSLAEQLLFKPDGGIVAGIVPTGLSFPIPQRLLMQALFAELIENKAATLGEAMQKAKQRIDSNVPENREVIETFGLLGDPALEIY